ncbi:MAG: BON domain-containing protein [Solirubrobacterales bacterium]|nr:BON domain-containing protein [Solirubrobacterales bacterium]MBV9423197.1 BON domain-containing protein [Solirubrobacterales bacterium]MBV9799611.1 BON domain-containing protein [Solirubrobacterales bacterium]
MSNDNVIVDEIRVALEHDSRLPHPAEVAISEQAGTVTLRGTVASPGQRRAAVQIAKTVAGVRDVEDELRVDPRDRFDDDQIRGVAIQALMSDREVPDGRIKVTVVDSWLTLKGEVKHQYESNAAFEAVCGIPGVGGITNEIRVVTAGVDG